jgi:hypothetical protein
MAGVGLPWLARPPYPLNLTTFPAGFSPAWPSSRSSAEETCSQSSSTPISTSRWMVTRPSVQASSG